MQSSANPKAFVWGALLDSVGIILILVAFLALGDGSQPSILGIFTNVVQFVVAAFGLTFITAGAYMLFTAIRG